MSKKRNRQSDPNGDLSDGSTDSCDKSFTTASKCPHVAKAVSFNKIKKCIIKTGMSIECTTCKKSTSNSMKTKEEESAISSGILICLQCGHQGCGKEQCGHALEHYKKPHSDCHSLAVESVHWSIWCFECEIEVTTGCRKKLQETIEFVKRAATAMNSPSQNKVIQNQFQKETVNVDKNEKEQILNNLPKVGGLMNLGNTCFFNAVLQCLAQTPFLVKVLEDLRLPGQKFVLPGGKHKPANSSEEIELPPIEGTLEGWGNFTSILCKTLTEMQNSDGRQAYNPSELLNSFKKKTMQCMDGGQHDSHELLRHLLEIVRNEDLRRYQSIILEEVGLNGKTNPKGVEDSLKSRVKFYGNQASARLLGPELVFRGVLVSTVECLDCHHTSQSMEPFLDLSLPVMADKPQPPVLKRKNSGFEDSFNVISHSPSKYQLKKEMPVRKNRKNRKQEIINIYEKVLSDKNNIAEENNGSILESEKGDADVEDNIEAESLPEVAESGYSSEKQSALASPASPSTDVMKPNENMNELPLNNENGLQMPPTSNLNLLQLQDHFNPKALPGSSPTNACVENSSQPKVSDGLDSSESVENESEAQTSTSLAVISDLTSPEVPTISLSSISSKESPNSPISGGINGENGVINERPARRKIEEYSNEVNNAFDGVISEISKIIISSNNQQSPTRYPTKEGECLIQSCLNQFAALELMSGSNKVGCEACTAREKKVKGDCKMVCTPSTKQYLISRVPAVLILHLKRFQAQRIDFRKVTRHVSFPTLLNLAPVCKNHRKPRIYALYGVVEHSGTIHGGHYVAYVKSRLPLKPDDPRWSFLPPKDPQDMQESSSDSEPEEATSTLPTITEPPPGKWYHISDSRVSEVDETTVLQSQAYLLFYERIF